MEMILQVLLLVLGFLMLVKGADWFVDGASGIAERFGIPAFPFNAELILTAASGILVPMATMVSLTTS